jgi:cobalt-zinc-cadmium efflux system protein
MTGHSHGVTATGRHRQVLITVLALTGLVAVAEVIGALIKPSIPDLAL